MSAAHIPDLPEPEAPGAFVCSLPWRELAAGPRPTVPPARFRVPPDHASVLRDLLPVAEAALRWMPGHLRRDLSDAVQLARAQMRALDAAELDRREAQRPNPDGGAIPHCRRVTERHEVDPFPLEEE